ncbi:Ig-like domain-containing protein [Mycolicibacterium phlei]
MGYARYVGRVGVLAVALGVGTAVAGTAWADTGTESVSSSDASQTTDSSDTGASSPESGADPTPEDPDVETAEPEDDTDGIEDDTDGIEDDTESEETPEDQSTSVEAEPPTDDQPPATPAGDGSAATEFEAAVGPQPSTTPTGHGSDTPVTPAESNAVAESVAEPDLPDLEVDAAQTVLRQTSVDPAADEAPAATTYEMTVDDPVEVPAPAPLRKQPDLIGIIIGGPVKLLNIAATAIGMLFHPATAPSDQPLLLGVLAFARREIQRTFFNTPANAVADVVTTSEGVPVTVDVLGNDVDPDRYPGGDVLTVTGYTQAANGTVAINADGTFTYTPDAGFAGTDTFTYTISDDASPWHVDNLFNLLRGNTNSTATVTVDVGAPGGNRAPSAADDAAGTAADTPVEIDVLANDTDPDGDALTVTAVSTAAGGGSVVIDDGRLVYTPASGFSGEDTFTYTVSDGNATDTGTVTVTVTPAATDNQAPVVGDEAFDFTVDDEAGFVTGTVHVTDPDGDGLTFALGTVSNSALGEVTVDPATGSWVFTPSAAALIAAYNSASPLVAEFSIDASDGQATVPVTVAAPVAVSATTLVARLERAGSRPSGVAVGADGTVYVINSGANTLSVLSADATSILSTVHVGASPSAVRVGSDGRVWVANGADGTVTVLDPTGTAVDATIGVGSSPTGLAIGPDGSVYVANTGDGTISVIDPATNAVDRTIAIGGTPTGIAAGPDGRLYVADFDSTVTVFDPAAGDTAVAIDGAGANPFGIAVGADGTVYVTHPVDGTLSILTPTATGYTGRTVAVGPAPTAVAVTADGFIYVTESGAAGVTVVDPHTFTTTTVAAGTGPNSIAAGPDGNVFVTNGESDTLSIIDTQTGSSAAISVGVNPNTVTVDSDGALSVTNNYDNTVSVIKHPVGEVTTGEVSTGTVTTGTVTTGAVTGTGYTIATGGGPSRVVVSPDGRYAYIASAENGTVSIIDPATGTVTTIPTGPGAGDYGDVVVTPDGRFAYVINSGGPGGHTLSIINPANGTATTIPVGFSVFSVAVSPDSRYAYVTGSGIGGTTVTVIDPVAGTATTTGPISEAALVDPVVVSPDGRYAYARTRDGVSIINPATGTATTIATGRYVYSPEAPVVVSPDSRYAFVTNRNDGTVTVLNPATGTATTIAVGAEPGQVVVSPDSRYAFVTSYRSDTVTIINPATGTVTAVAPVSDPGGQVVVSSDSRFAYVTSYERDGGGVTIINAATGATTTVRTGTSYPQDLTVSPDNRYVYALDSDDGTVSIIDPVAGTATTVAIGNASFGLVISPDGRYAYVTNGGDGTVSVIDPVAGTATAIATGDSPGQVVVSPDGRYAYVTNANGMNDDTVSIINPATGTSTTVTIPDSRNFLGSRLAVSPDGRYAYIAYQAVTVINPDTGTAATIPANYYTNAAIPVSPDSRYAYVTSGDGVVTVIDPAAVVFSPGRIVPDHSAYTYLDTPVTFDPTANPFLPDSGLTITGISAPANGTAVLQGSYITYTPDTGYTGPDTFTYTATNGTSTGTGTIVVHVNKVYESVPYEAGPSGTQDLYRTLRDAMDGVDGKSLQHGVYTQHVLVDGRQSLIVYIAGTKEGLIGGDQSVIKNLPSASGVVDENQIAVIKAAMTDPGEPILLVGFSQGGMDAQNIAANAARYGLQDQIKAVVTYGSPLVQVDRYPTVHLQDHADVVPKVNLFTPTTWIAGIVNFGVNKNVYLASSTNTFNTAVLTNWSTWGVHGVRSTYEDIGLRFDVDTSSHWDGVHDALDGFLGGRVVPDGYTVVDGAIKKL